MAQRPERGGASARTPAVETAQFTIDYIRGQGPARSKLRKTFGTEMKNAHAALSNPAGALLRVGVANDIGARPRNEDSAVALVGHLGDAVPVVLAGVADGIGGANDGDLAGALALHTLTEDVVDELGYLEENKVDKMLNASNVEDLLMEAASDAHATIREQTDGGGSTLTCALIFGGTAYIAHVGDSRAYLIDTQRRDVEQITRDHRVVRKLEELGVITAEQAKHHPQGHVLYRSLGIKDPCDLDFAYRILPPGSRLLVCTDGVSDVLSRDEIYRIVTHSDDPQDACEGLIKAAADHNSHDDATAVLVEMPD